MFLYLHINVVKLPFGTFAHTFCFILINVRLASELLIKCGSRVVHKLFNKTMQKLSA